MRKSFLLIFILALSIISCDEDAKTNIVAKEVDFTKEGELYLIKATGDTLEKIVIEIADNPYERETGLMYRDSIDQNQGMLFIFEDEKMRSFYMKNTKIPLDIFYINADKEIVSFIDNAQPLDENSLPSEAPAQYVLELNSDTSENLGLATGDKISFERTPSATE